MEQGLERKEDEGTLLTNKNKISICLGNKFMSHLKKKKNTSLFITDIFKQVNIMVSIYRNNC